MESDTKDSTLEELVCSKDKQIEEINKIVWRKNKEKVYKNKKEIENNKNNKKK